MCGNILEHLHLFKYDQHNNGGVSVVSKFSDDTQKDTSNIDDIESIVVFSLELPYELMAQKPRWNAFSSINIWINQKKHLEPDTF